MARVMAVARGWEHTRAYHTLLLPRNFQATAGRPPARDTAPWPVLVEFPGNYCGPGGPAELDGCGSSWTMQGWGAGAYTGEYIWLTLPFLTADLGTDTAVQLLWWGCGDVDGTNCTASGQRYNATPTVEYARAAIQDVLQDFGGDPQRLVVLGHSRGAIATQAIAFADAGMARLWRGAIAASHYDDLCAGAPANTSCEGWPYSNGPEGFQAAAERARLAVQTPKFLTGECNLESGWAVDWLRHAANVSTARVTAVPSGFRDHTGFWIARPSAARTQLRRWLQDLMSA